MVIFFRSMETTRSASRCPAESAKANRTFFSGSAAASALACTLFPTKTMFFVRIRPQGVQSGIQLRIAQDHKDHIVHCIRCKFSHHRNAADRCAERKFILDPQAVLPDLLCPVSPGKQGDILSGVKQISCQIAPSKHLHHIPEFSLLASKSDLYNLHLHHSVTDPLARKRKNPLTDGSFKSL